MAITWNDRYSVGITQIDMQHKALVDIINRFEEISESKDRYLDHADMLNEVIDETKNYTVLHFATEELLMEMFEYPGYVDHKKSHVDFIALVVDSQNQIKDVLQRRKDAEDQATKDRLTIELQGKVKKVLVFLQQWLINHIMKSDKEYTEFFLKIKKKAMSSGGWMAFLKR